MITQRDRLYCALDFLLPKPYNNIIIGNRETFCENEGLN